MVKLRDEVGWASRSHEMKGLECHFKKLRLNL